MLNCLIRNVHFIIRVSYFYYLKFKVNLLVIYVKYMCVCVCICVACYVYIYMSIALPPDNNFISENNSTKSAHVFFTRGDHYITSLYLLCHVSPHPSLPDCPLFDQ